MSAKVVVIDYGIGNLHSVVKALRHEGGDVTVSSRAADVAGAERLVLPGVGAFADGMAGLRGRDLVEPILELVGRGRPFLGICLGMQLLLGESEEFGRHTGLGIIPGRVVEIARGPGLKVPHVGWNRISPRPEGDWAGTLLDAVPRSSMFYFVHSFTAVPDDEKHRLADAHYGPHRLSAALARDNVVGCQFHPEKSGPLGLSILRSFLSR